MEYELKLTTEEVNKILNTLAVKPYHEVVEIINKIQKQAQEQQEKE